MIHEKPLMRTILLFYTAGELFGIDKEHLVSIVKKNSDKYQVAESEGKSYLLLDKNRKAQIYDLASLFSTEHVSDKNGLFYVLNVNDNLLSLHVSAKGGLITVSREDIKPLPPLFNQKIHSFFPETILNGTDSILLLAPQALRKTASF